MAYQATDFDTRGERSTLSIVVVLCGVLLLVLLLGGGFSVGYSMVVSRDDDASDAEDEEGGQAPGFDFSFSGRRDNSPIGGRSSYRTPATIDEAIQLANDANTYQAAEAVKWLARQSVDSRKQTSVANALDGLLAKHRSSSMTGPILDALLVWGGKSNSRTVAAALRDGKGDARTAIKFLGKYPEPSAVDILAKQLENSSTAPDAADALRQLGPDAAGMVAEYVGTSRGPADHYARQLLSGWGVDPEDAIITRHVKILQGGEPHERREAARGLATIPVKADRQAEVARALDALLRLEDRFGKDEAIAALRVWGDKESVPSLILYAESERTGTVAVDALGDLADERAVKPLADMLDDFSKGEAAKKALAKIGKPAEEAVLERFNDANEQARERAKFLLQNFKTEDNKLLEQCVEDLNSVEERRRSNAARWLATAEVDADQQAEVAKRLVALIGTDPEAAAAGLSKWATKDQAAAMIPLLDNRKQEVWEPTLRALLVLADPIVLAPSLDKMLDSIFTRDKVLPVIVAAGEQSEEVLILIAQKSDQEDSIIRACDLLATLGTDKSISPLRDLQQRAVRAKRQNIAIRAANAIAGITQRAKSANDTEPDM